MSKANLSLTLKAETLTLPVIKTFKSPAGVVILQGTENSDHDLWLLNQEQKTATLIGTLVEKTFDKIKKTKTGEKVQLSPADYDYNNKVVDLPTELTGSTPGACKLNLTETFAATA